MRKILAALIAFCLVASPALADFQFGGYRLRTRNQPYVEIGGCHQIPVISSLKVSVGSLSEAFSWFGVQDISTSKLIQAGTDLIVNTNGTLDLQAFYELLPANKVHLPGGHPVAIGDWICGQLSCAANCNVSTTWAITLSDCLPQNFTAATATCSSNKWTYSNSVTYAVDNTKDAVFYVEDGLSGSYLPYPVYGCISWVGLTINNAPAVLNAADIDNMLQYPLTPVFGSGSGATASNPNSTGDGFWICMGNSTTGSVIITPPSVNPFSNPPSNGGALE